jgi:hypothetical protein
MNFLEKFYIKRCSTEVQIMLERMKDRPEDFDYGTGWRNLVEVADNEGSSYTRIERKMIRKYWKRCEHTRKRNELLSRIMSETINPTTRKDLEDQLRKQYKSSLVASMASTKHALTSGVLASYNDPRAIYGNPYQGMQP